MALTLRSCGSRIILRLISYDKTIRIGLHQHVLLSSQAGVGLTPIVENRNHTLIKQNSVNSIFKVDNTEYQPLVMQFGKGVVEQKRQNEVAGSIKLCDEHIRLVLQPKPNIRQEADNVADFTENKSNSNSTPDGRPSPDKLNHVFEILTHDLPRLFVHPFNYSVYHQDIIFENNIRGKRSVGLFGYMRQIAFVRMVGHFKFAYVKLDVLKITQHPEDSTIKVRWTMNGITGWKVIVMFWKYKLWDFAKLFSKSVPWYDGFSTFHINAEGKIYKHVADKMMPDMDREETTTARSSIAGLQQH